MITLKIPPFYGGILYFRSIVSTHWLKLQNELRAKLLTLHYQSNSGHIGGSLSCLDILIAIYFGIKKDKDVFLLSKGHSASALYVVLNAKGIITDEQLATYNNNGTKLPIHPAANQLDEIPFALGSLGHGLALACGMALADTSRNVYVLLSDGETNEGSIWEAAQFAAKQQLSNLIVIVDKNGLQGFGDTNSVLGDTSSAERWKSFRFNVMSCNGHDISGMVETIHQSNSSKNPIPSQIPPFVNRFPTVILAETIKGKGVSFMENKLEWHYLPMNYDQYSKALIEIESRKSAQ